MSIPFRRVWADVDLDAIRHNVAVLAALAGAARLCAVVKADAYGHGAVPVALAALEAGATWLGVATVEEGIELRDAAITAPILLLSEPPVEAMKEVVARGLTPVVYTRGAADALTAATGRGGTPFPVHVKIDTGMHRVGAALDDAIAVAAAIDAAPGLRLGGLCTHFAVADEPDDSFTAEQVQRFEHARARFAAAGLAPELCHAANSAGIIAHPAARYDLVRAGISMYGYAPSRQLEGLADLRPALTLRAEVSFVKTVDAGERISYGLRYTFDRPSVVATLPIGYADGVFRRLSEVGGEVLIRGRRHPIAGVVTMDQLTVDCAGTAVAAGDEAVLIGAQGGERITADDWGRLLDTISYEVLCHIGTRVPRVHHG
jgi:alanine racemase